jgi:hypothetical protein
MPLGYDLVTVGGHPDKVDEGLVQNACFDCTIVSKPHAMTDKRPAPKATVTTADQYLLGMVNHLLATGGCLTIPVTT